MRREKPLPKESSFKEYVNNRPAPRRKPRQKGISKAVAKIVKKDFNRRDDKPDRRQSRGNSFKEGRRNSRGSKFGDRNRQSGDREMFDAVCSKCKKPCKVPFKPTNGKPVLCSNCFVKKDRNDNSRRSGGFQSRGKDNQRSSFQRRDNNQNRRSFGGDREMFDAVCSKCKKPCKIPFKPITGRPVYCSNCFVKKESSGRGRSNFGTRDSSNGRNSERRDSSGRRDSGRRDSGRIGGFSRGRNDSRGPSRGRDVGRRSSKDSSRKKR